MPNRYLPLTYPMDQSQLVATLNKNFGELDGETVTKVYKGANNQIAIIEGKLPYEGGYGLLIYDSDGDSRVLVGIAPDGSIGLFVSKTGEDLISAFS